MLEDMVRGIEEKLKKQPISSRVLLDRLRLLDESSRKTSQYQDPNYLPFYYYMSKFVSPKMIFHVGLDLGLPICCFLMGFEGVEKILAFQKASKSFYSPKIAMSNIMDIKKSGLSFDYYFGEVLDGALEDRMSFKFDLVLITSAMTSDELNDVLEISWRHMNLGSFLAVDHVVSNPKSGAVVSSFCKSKGRPCSVIDTRYGVALTEK
jgi:hypothetical protein